MAIRLLPALKTNGQVDHALFRANMIGNSPVGRCDCGGAVYAVDITRSGRLTHYFVRCSACFAEASWPVRTATAAAPSGVVAPPGVPAQGRQRTHRVKARSGRLAGRALHR